MSIYHQMLSSKYQNINLAFVKIFENGEIEEITALEEKNERLGEVIIELKQTKSFVAEKCEDLQKCKWCEFTLMCGERGVFMTMSYTDFITIFVPVFGGIFYYFHTLFKEKEQVNELVVNLNKYRYYEFYRFYLNKTLHVLDESLGELSLNMYFIGRKYKIPLRIIYSLYIDYILFIMANSR